MERASQGANENEDQCRGHYNLINEISNVRTESGHIHTWTRDGQWTMKQCGRDTSVLGTFNLEYIRQARQGGLPGVTRPQTHQYMEHAMYRQTCIKAYCISTEFTELIISDNYMLCRFGLRFHYAFAYIKNPSNFGNQMIERYSHSEPFVFCNKFS